MKERLQKLMAQANIGSRRASEELILQKRVRVNGEIASLGDKADPETDLIEVDGERLNFDNRRVYLALNKPINVLTTTQPHQSDDRRTVMDLVPLDHRHLFTIGRLDADSEGLVVITNDGEMANNLAHPRYRHTKTYRVVVEGLPTAETVEQWQKGVWLGDEDGMTAPCYVKITKGNARESVLRVVMTEGKKRQIRRVAAMLGHPVKELQRTHIGQLELGELRPGEYRELKMPEVKLMQMKAPEYGEIPRKRRAERGDNDQPRSRRDASDEISFDDRPRRKLVDMDDDDAIDEAPRPRRPRPDVVDTSGEDRPRRPMRRRSSLSPSPTGNPDDLPAWRREGQKMMDDMDRSKRRPRREGEGSDRPRYPRRDGESSDRPRRARSEYTGSGEDRPRRPRPYGERSSDDRPRRPRSEFSGSGEDRPRRPRPAGDSSDRPRYPRRDGEGSDRPRRARSEGESSDRPRRPRPSGEGSDRPRYPRRDGEGSDRPRRARSEGDSSDRPRRPRPSGEGSDRPRYPRRDGEGSDRPRRARSEGESADRPRRASGSAPNRGSSSRPPRRPSGDRSSGGFRSENRSDAPRPRRRPRDEESEE